MFKEIKKSARYWWITLIQGLLFLFLGLLFVFSPSDSLFVVIQLLAVYWLLSGAFAIVEATIGKYEGSRFWGFLSGFVSVLAAVFMLAYPLVAYEVTTVFWIYFVGITSIVYGILQFIEGNTVKKNVGKDWSWGNNLLGVFNIIFGVLLLIFPFAAAIAYIWIVGIIAILGAFALFVTAFRLQKIASLMDET